MNKILFFKRANCSNCKQVEPILDALDDITVEKIDADTNQDLVKKYAPTTQWQLPLLVCFEDDKEVGVTTGIVSEFDVQLAFKPVSELEAMAYRTIKNLTTGKQVILDLEKNIKVIENIIEKKMTKVDPLDSNLPMSESVGEIKARPEECTNCAS
jgi:thiol-disulfide isomerase/thioredoxin